jgi:hypothetical protein
VIAFLAAEGEKLTCIHECLLEMHGQAGVDVTAA